MNLLPKARTGNLLEQESGKEMLIYDLTINKAYHLNETSKIVYQNCNGRISFDKLKKNHLLTDDIIYFALDELMAHDLIEGRPDNHFGGLSRREVIRKVGLASMIALPVIVGITAPTAYAASSCVNPGGLPAGTNAQFGCALDQEICNDTCNTEFGGSCCSNTASARPVCASKGFCFCFCT